MDNQLGQDPFSIVRNHFWEVLGKNPYFKNVIRENNRIRFEDEIGSKVAVGHGDLPELQLLTDTFSQPNGLGTSCNSYLSMGLIVHVATGSRDTRVVSRLQWEVFRTIQTFCKTGRFLTYNDIPFFVLATLESGAQGQSSADIDRGITGFSATWQLRVDLQFQNSDVLFTIK